MKSRYFKDKISTNESIVLLITEGKFLGYNNTIKVRTWLFSLEGKFVEMIYDRTTSKFQSPQLVSSDYVVDHYLQKLEINLIN